MPCVGMGGIQAGLYSGTTYARIKHARLKDAKLRVENKRACLMLESPTSLKYSKSSSTVISETAKSWTKYEMQSRCIRFQACTGANFRRCFISDFRVLVIPGIIFPGGGRCIWRRRIFGRAVVRRRTAGDSIPNVLNMQMQTWNLQYHIYPYLCTFIHF